MTCARRKDALYLRFGRGSRRRVSAAAVHVLVPCLLTHEALQDDHEQAHCGHERKARRAHFVADLDVVKLHRDRRLGEVVKGVGGEALQHRERRKQGGGAAAHEARLDEVHDGQEHWQRAERPDEPGEPARAHALSLRPW